MVKTASNPRKRQAEAVAGPPAKKQKNEEDLPSTSYSDEVDSNGSDLEESFEMTEEEALAARFEGDIDVSEVVEECAERGTLGFVKRAFEKLIQCWLSNSGISLEEGDKSEPRLKAFIGMRALLDLVSGTNPELGKIKRNSKGLTSNQLVARFLKQLVDIVATEAKGARLHWHVHDSVAFWMNGISHLISRHIGSGAAYLMLFTMCKDLGETVKAPIALHAKPLPKKKKELGRHKDKIAQLEGALYNWRFLLQLQIVITVLSDTRLAIEKIDKDGVPPSDSAEKKLLAQYDEIMLLCYPLYCTMMACLKFKWGKAGYVSFNCHLLRRLVELMAKAKTFVPVGVPLCQMMEQLANLAKNSKPMEGDSLTKDSAVAYTTLRLSATHVKMSVVIDDLWHHFMLSLHIYANALASHPSYPEMIVPVGAAIRASQKDGPHRVPAAFYKELDTFMKASKSTSDMVRKQREKITLTKATKHTMSLIKLKGSQLSQELNKAQQRELQRIQDVRQ